MSVNEDNAEIDEFQDLTPEQELKAAEAAIHHVEISPTAKIMLALTAFVAAICGGLYGYDTGIISGALLLITSDFHLNSGMQELVASSILIGAVMGALLAGSMSERYGRRFTATIVSAVFVLGAIACSFAQSVTQLIIFRIFLGLAVGGSTQVVPMYISELAPAGRRGNLVTMFNVAIGIGILLANIIGFAARDAWGWRPMIGLAAIPAGFVFLCLLFLPRSPRWTAENEGLKSAIAELSRIRTSKKAILREIREMHEIAESTDPLDKGWRGLAQPWVRPAVIAALGVAFFTQVGGLEMMIYYAPTFLHDAGFGKNSALLASLGVAITYCVMTFLGCLTVDKIGRRRLMLVTGPISVLSMVGLGIVFSMHPTEGSVGAWLVIFFLLSFMASNSIGIQICGWLTGAEMFPLCMRGQATSLFAATLWGADLLVTITALTLVQLVTLGGAMWVYAAVNVLTVIFVFRFVPELSGASLEDIEYALRKKRFAPRQGRTRIVDASDV